MFDLLLTIALIYLAYRAYQWYQGVKEQSGAKPPRKVYTDERGMDPTATQPGDEDDYIEYEELKEPKTERRTNDL